MYKVIFLRKIPYTHEYYFKCVKCPWFHYVRRENYLDSKLTFNSAGLIYENEGCRLLQTRDA